MKPSRILLGIAVLVVAGLAYARVSRFDRLATRAATTPVRHEDWDVLRQRPDDPRVIAAAVVELHDAIELSGCESVTRVSTRAGAVLDAHPTSDEESLAAIARMVAGCNDRRPLKWTARPPEDLVKTVRKDVAGIERGDLLIDALVEAGPRMSQDLVDVIVRALKPTDSKAEALLAAGLPDTNEKLVPPDGHALRRPAGTDERVATGIRSWLGAFEAKGPKEADAQAIARALTFSPSPHLDDPMAAALAKTIETVGAVKMLCAKLVIHPNDADVLARHATGPAAKACAEPAQQMKGALALLNATAAAATQFEDDKGEGAKQRRDAWEDEQAASIAKLGPTALAAAREGLKSNARTVRRVSARVMVKLDRKAYAAAIAERFRAHAGHPDDAKLALELAGARDVFDPTAVLATFYLGDLDVEKRAVAVLKREKPETWVPMLFADVSVTAASTPGVLKGYAEALEQTPGAAAQAATMLDAALVRAGRAEGVFWLTKTLALRSLKKQGTAVHAPLVEKFVRDKTTYPVIKLRNENFTGEIHEESRTTRTIGELATETLTAVKGR